MGTEAVGGNNTSKSKPRPPHTGVQDHWLEWQVAIVILFFFFLIFFACKHKWLVLWELNVNLKCLLRTEYGSSSSTTSISMPGQPALVWSWQLEEPSEVLLAGGGLRLCLDPAGYRHLGWVLKRWPSLLRSHATVKESCGFPMFHFLFCFIFLIQE